LVKTFWGRRDQQLPDGTGIRLGYPHEMRSAWASSAPAYCPSLRRTVAERVSRRAIEPTHRTHPAANREHPGRLAGVSFLSSVLTPGVVAATVTVLLYVWVQRPRADLQMVRINQTVEVAKWLALARTDRDAEEAMKHWQARDIVLLTNYGDGTAYDIKLSGSHCRPRVWVRDMGRQEMQDGPVVAAAPMWSDKLGALEPGQKISVVVMSSPDPTLPRPVLEVSWPRLPGRRLGRKKRRHDLANARTIETGWPGKTDTTS
jgi:hypothetical protein